MSNPRAGITTQYTSNVTISAVSGGSLTGGSGYVWVYEFNQVGRSMLSNGAASPSESGFPLTWTAGQKWSFSFPEPAAGKSIYGFGVAFSATDDASTAKEVAQIRARGTATVGAVDYPGQGAALSFPLTLELTTDDHIATDVIVASEGAVPSSPKHGNVINRSDLAEYWRYDSEASSGKLASGGGYWVAHSTGFSAYISSLDQAAVTDTQPQGSRRPLNQLEDGVQSDVVISTPPYPFEGALQDPDLSAVFHIDGPIPQGSRVEVIFKINGANYSIAFASQAIATLLGKVDLSDGTLDTTADGVGSPVTLGAGALGVGVLETPEDLDEGFTWAYRIQLQADASAIATPIRPLQAGDVLTYYPVVVGRLGERAQFADVTGEGVAQVGSQRLVLPKVGTAKARMLDGTAIIVDSANDYGYTTRSKGAEDVDGIANSTDDQRVVINGPYNDIRVRATAGDIQTYEGQRAIVGTGLGPDSGYYTPTAFSSAVAIAGSSETLRVVVTHPTAIRSDYPDSAIVGNSNGDFNANEIPVFVRYSGTIYELTYPRGASPQTIDITSLGATTRGSLPDSSSEPEFGLFDNPSFTASAVTAGSSLAAGSYEVSVGQKFNGSQVTSIDHSTANGSMRVIPSSGNIAYLDETQQFTKAQRSAVSALSISSGTLNIDCELANTYTLTIDENVTTITATNIALGTEFDVKVTQDGNNGYTMTGWSSDFGFLGNPAPTINTSNNGETILGFKSFDGTTLDVIGGV